MEAYKEAVAQCLTGTIRATSGGYRRPAAYPQSPPGAISALPCFTFAKAWRQAPLQVAAQLAATIAVRSRLPRSRPRVPTSTLPWTTGSSGVTCCTRILAAGKHYGHGEEGRGKKVVIDYSSPNIAKELAFHHIRSTMIGHALMQILRARGYTVEGDNHLGDWGTPFGLPDCGLQALWLGRPGRRGSHCAAQCALCAGQSQTAKDDAGIRRGGTPLVPAARSG